jgi:chromate reductase
MDDESPVRILLVGGSLRMGSTSGAALETARLLAPPATVATVYEGLRGLPHFDPDVEQHAPPAPVLDLRASLAAADGVLFATPEYAGSLPGAFKNLLDWTVGEGLHRKPVGWINPSAHGGSTNAYQQLRTVLGYVNADLVGAACVAVPIRRDAIGADGASSDGLVRERIAAAIRALVEHVRGGGDAGK